MPQVTKKKKKIGCCGGRTGLTVVVVRRDMAVKPASAKTQSRRVFGHPRRTIKSRAARRPLCAGLQPRSVDVAHANSRSAGICCPTGLGHHHAGEGSQLWRLTAADAGEADGGRAAPRHRRCAGLASGSLGQVGRRFCSPPCRNWNTSASASCP